MSHFLSLGGASRCQSLLRDGGSSLQAAVESQSCRIASLRLPLITARRHLHDWQSRRRRWVNQHTSVSGRWHEYDIENYWNAWWLKTSEPQPILPHYSPAVSSANVGHCFESGMVVAWFCFPTYHDSRCAPPAWLPVDSSLVFSFTPTTLGKRGRLRHRMGARRVPRRRGGVWNSNSSQWLMDPRDIYRCPAE